jgi:hypothetical protein
MKKLLPFPNAYGAATLALVLALGAAPALAQETPWLRVQVDGEDDNSKVELNLPLAAVEALGGSLGEHLLDEIEEEWNHEDEVDLDADDLRAFWQSLRDNPGAWVTIDEEDGGNFRARMDGNEVRIEGGDDDGSLDIRFPVAFGDALFGASGGDPDLGAAIRSLAGHEDVLISVDGDDGKVRVWIEPR